LFLLFFQQLNVIILVNTVAAIRQCLSHQSISTYVPAEVKYSKQAIISIAMHTVCLVLVHGSPVYKYVLSFDFDSARFGFIPLPWKSQSTRVKLLYYFVAKLDATKYKKYTHRVSGAAVVPI
jgi:hypothetical protein